MRAPSSSSSGRGSGAGRFLNLKNGFSGRTRFHSPACERISTTKTVIPVRSIPGALKLARNKLLAALIEAPSSMQRIRSSVSLYVAVFTALTCLLGATITYSQRVPQSSTVDPALHSKFAQVVENQKKNDTAMDLFERIERVELKKNVNDPQPDVKISRVIPAGTGTDHIAVGPDGSPTDLVAYRAALEKLVTALSFAIGDGRAQHDAYEKIAKKHKDRDDLVDATRNAFIFTYISSESRADRTLSKYSMLPNPAFKPTSRTTGIFAHVRGFVWIDDQALQLARV